MAKYLDKLSLLIALTAGTFAFLIVCGPSILNPLNESWLLGGGDLTQQYFGWAFFRHSPWTLPLGLNPMYGMDISSSIVYSDGNPLISILLKPFRTYLPHIFQFQGLWLYFCWLMQIYVAWKILGLYTQDKISRILGSLLFSFSVPFLFRIGVHTNLAAHFLILGALYLNLRSYKSDQAYWWALLLVMSLGVHFYIFAMVGILWIADLCDKSFIQKATKPRSILASFAITVFITIIFGWLYGYFSVSSPSLFGYGFFKANVLSIFNPNGWSYFIKDLPIKSSWGEGNLYLGLGAISLISLGLLSKIFWKSHDQIFTNHKYLKITLIALVLFSITNQIGIGSFEFRIPFPQWMLNIFGILRHSARLFWPFFYAILILGSLWVIQNFKARAVRFIFAACLILQIVDLLPGMVKLHAELNNPVKNDITLLPLHQPFWKVASKRYKNLYILPSRSEPYPDFMSRFMSSDWKIFGRFAALNQLNTNAVYLSRYDSNKQIEAFEKSQNTIKNDVYDPDTLYIIKNEDVIPVALGLKNDKTLLANIDGFNVLAPNLLNSINPVELGNYTTIKIDQLRPTLNSEISFKRSASNLSTYTLTKGWNNREEWGIWSKGDESILTLPLPSKKASLLTLNVRAFVNGAIPQQKLIIESDIQPIGTFNLNSFEKNIIQINIPASAFEKEYISLTLKMPNASSPLSIGMDKGDDRILGIGLISAKFN